MARFKVDEQKSYPTLPDDSVLHVKVEKIDIRTVKGQRGDWDKLEFEFKVLGVLKAGDGSHISNYDALIGESIYGSVSARFTDSPENKARLWAEALFGRTLELGFELDTDWLIRRECKAVTSTWEKKSINPATGQPFIGHQVASLLPLGEMQASQPQQAPAAAQPGGWGTPGVQQQQFQQPQQQQGWGQSQQQPPQQPTQPQQPSQTPQDPWGTPGDDGPGF